MQNRATQTCTLHVLQATYHEKLHKIFFVGAHIPIGLSAQCVTSKYGFESPLKQSCVGTLSKSFTYNCSLPSMFCCMVMCALQNFQRRDISIAVVLRRVLHQSINQSINQSGPIQAITYHSQD